MGGRWLGVFAPLFQQMLDRIDRGLEAGAIEATLPDGRTRLLGGRAPGRWRSSSCGAGARWCGWRLDGSAGWYVAWAKGEWASPDPVPLFDLFMRNRVALGEAAGPGVGRNWCGARGTGCGATTAAAPGATSRSIMISAMISTPPGWIRRMTYSSAMFDRSGRAAG